MVNLEGDKTWVAFRYERIMGLCYSCGRLGHDMSLCPHRCSSMNLDEPIDNPYSEWMKAGGWHGTDGPRDQGRNSPQQRKEDNDGESTRKPPVHISPTSLAESDNTARETDFTKKTNLLSTQEGAEVTCWPSTHLMGVDVTHNFTSVRTEKGIMVLLAT